MHFPFPSTGTPWETENGKRRFAPAEVTPESAGAVPTAGGLCPGLPPAGASPKRKIHSLIYLEKTAIKLRERSHTGMRNIP